MENHAFDFNRLVNGYESPSIYSGSNNALEKLKGKTIVQLMI